jgi:hypothetical protein
MMQITTLAQDRHGPLEPSKLFFRRTTGFRAGNFDTKDRDSMRCRTTTSFKGLPPLRRSVEELGFTVIFTKTKAPFALPAVPHLNTLSSRVTTPSTVVHVDDLQQTREAGLQLQHRDTQQQAQGKHGKRVTLRHALGNTNKLVMGRRAPTQQPTLPPNTQNAPHESRRAASVNHSSARGERPNMTKSFRKIKRTKKAIVDCCQHAQTKAT